MAHCAWGHSVEPRPLAHKATHGRRQHGPHSSRGAQLSCDAQHERLTIPQPISLPEPTVHPLSRLHTVCPHSVASLTPDERELPLPSLQSYIAAYVRLANLSTGSFVPISGKKDEGPRYGPVSLRRTLTAGANLLLIPAH